METALLQTKFYIPPARPEQISRPHLIERLEQGIAPGRKLTLVSAPAGFGKTTLVSEWIHTLRDTVLVAWLSLDESDNDLNCFLSYFIAALNQVEGMETPLDKGVLSALQSPQPPPPEAVLTTLINEIAVLPNQIMFVLDDYHLIETPPIHDALSFLLRRLPPQLHFTIVTREDPPLPLARLRARGQLMELRAADLRFTSSEAAKFLNQAMGLELSTDDIAALESRTEGWIAGLQLAALSIQGHKGVTDFIQSFTGSHRFVLDYLVEEVLEQQTEDVQTFLLQTAILDRLTGSLCDTLTGQATGQATLEMLERANLFIVPLDNERQWYRYHHLFADLLHQRLRQSHPEQIPTLHRRASVWYGQNDLPSDAIRHALAAEDFERAADLAELAWPTWSVSFRSITWLRWAKNLPEAVVRARPVLSLAYAWAFLNAGQLEAAESKLEVVEWWLKRQDTLSDQAEAPTSQMVVVDEKQFQALPASLATARAYHAQASGDVRSTAKYVAQALDLLPEDDHYNRAAVTGLLGLAYWASGDLEAAHKMFYDGFFQNDHDLINGTFVLADMEMTLGHLREAIHTCEHALQLAAEYVEPFPLGTEDVYTGISELHREQGDLKAAAEDLATARKLGEQVALPDWQYRWCIAQARLKETLGELDETLDLLDKAEHLYVRTPLPVIRPIAARKARVWIKQGRLAEALGWVRERDLSVDDDLSYPREFEHITLARLLITQYKYEYAENAIREVLRLLARLLKAAEQGGRMGSVIEILVLQALAFEAQDNRPAARKPLERALMLAEPEGYAHLFVDEGPPMARLLYEALNRGIMPGYTGQLLEKFPAAETEQADALTTQAANSELIEPLSEREIEVLHLIAEGLTNPEIASQLYIALNTVKAHTRNIYGKLGVNNRTQAAAKAKALGLLPST